MGLAELGAFGDLRLPAPLILCLAHYLSRRSDGETICPDVRIAAERAVYIEIADVCQKIACNPSIQFRGAGKHSQRASHRGLFSQFGSFRPRHHILRYQSN